MINLATLCRHSPVFLQNLGVSLHGLRLYFREYGRKFTTRLAEFEKRQWCSPDELRAYQNDRLRLLIRHCYAHVPYYRRVMRERGLKPDDIRSVDDLPKFPLLTREMVREHAAELLADNTPKWQLVHGHTNGTTGSPLALVWDRRTCLIKNVVEWRHKRLVGLNPGDKMAFFLSRPVVPMERSRPPFWRHNWTLRHLYFSGWHMSPQNLDKYVEQLKCFRPKSVEGYPSTMYILARFILSMNATFPVYAAFTSSEPLLPHQRMAIEKAFACKVFNFYGMAERVIFAGECPAHQGMHLNSDFGITEILDQDGQPTAAGGMGRIVATGLHNLGMPLIRYQTSDVTSLKTISCSCSSGFPLLEDVTGRDVDIVTTQDGRYISPLILSALYLDLDTVIESQLIQEDVLHLRMKVVRGLGYTDKDTRFLLEQLKLTLGGGMNVEVEFVATIPRSSSGKFRWIVSKVPLEF